MTPCFSLNYYTVISLFINISTKLFFSNDKTIKGISFIRFYAYYLKLSSHRPPMESFKSLRSFQKSVSRDIPASSRFADQNFACSVFGGTFFLLETKNVEWVEKTMAKCGRWVYLITGI